jgi:hypothetical protein
MHAAYEDILDAVGGKAPLWWDQNGVPRFRPHHPDLASDIYAAEVALLRIACQRCLLEQLVQMTWSPTDVIREESVSLADSVRDGTIHYGDPPRHDDRGEFCHAGCTMNVWDLKVEEFWTREGFDWVRVPELEVTLPDGEPCACCGAPTPECACVEGPQRREEAAE